MFGDDPATAQNDNSVTSSSDDQSASSTGFDNGFMPPSASDDAQLATTHASSYVASSDPAQPAASSDPSDNNSTAHFGAPASVQPSTDSKPLHQSGQSAPQLDDSQTDDLLSIKQEALGSLTPLVGHLEQAPEEKFRTLMMMIQASDDHSKLKEAYDAATQIADDKERAQALLDVINEINYFTHQENQS